MQGPLLEPQQTELQRPHLRQHLCLRTTSTCRRYPPKAGLRVWQLLRGLLLERELELVVVAHQTSRSCQIGRLLVLWQVQLMVPQLAVAAPRLLAASFRAHACFYRSLLQQVVAQRTC